MEGGWAKRVRLYIPRGKDLGHNIYVCERERVQRERKKAGINYYPRDRVHQNNHIPTLNRVIQTDNDLQSCGSGASKLLQCVWDLLWSTLLLTRLLFPYQMVAWQGVLIKPDKWLRADRTSQHCRRPFLRSETATRSTAQRNRRRIYRFIKQRSSSIQVGFLIFWLSKIFWLWNWGYNK